MAEANWYVVHTYSGYENKVMEDLNKTITNRGLQNQILEVKVPVQKVVEVKNGTKKEKESKLFPCYVLVKMIMTDDTWYVVRNTTGVTGFVGPGSKPVPLGEDEIRKMGIDKEPEIILDFDEGDTVTVISGAWADTQGVVTEINMQKQTVTVNVDMFGRGTPVELNFTDVKSDN